MKHPLEGFGGDSRHIAEQVSLKMVKMDVSRRGFANNKGDAFYIINLRSYDAI